MAHQFLKRSDGFAATIAAHSRVAGCGDCEDLIRDRTVEAHLPALVYFRCLNDDVRPGDTPVTEAEYDAFHTAMTAQNYERKFLADKRAASARVTAEHATHTATQADPAIPAAGKTLLRCACERRLADLGRTAASDEAELARCRADLVATGSTRKRRLRDEQTRLAAELPVCTQKRDDLRGLLTKAMSGRQRAVHSTLLERAEADVRGRESRLAVIAERLG